MRSMTKGALALGALSSAMLLQGCFQSESPVQPESVNSLAARITVPNSLGSLPVWNLAEYETITYCLAGNYKTYTSYGDQAREAFREWSAALTDYSHRVRFVETTDAEAANILVSSGGTSMTGGCWEGTRVRYCNLTTPSYHYILKGIGLIMGIPASTGTNDVMGSPNNGTIFSPADLSAIRSYYNVYNENVEPIFDVPYYNSTGNEIVVGWETLRWRAIPGQVYVKRTLGDRRLIGGALYGGNPGHWNFAGTFPMYTYQRVSGTGAVYLQSWPHQNYDYSFFDPVNAIKGTESSTPILGYSACSDASISALESSTGNAPAIFAFDPSVTWVGGNPNISKQAPRYVSGQIVPLYFFKDVATGRWRVANKAPTGNVTCTKLGGYALAMQ